MLIKTSLWEGSPFQQNTEQLETHYTVLMLPVVIFNKSWLALGDLTQLVFSSLVLKIPVILLTDIEQMKLR